MRLLAEEAVTELAYVCPDEGEVCSVRIASKEWEIDRGDSHRAPAVRYRIRCLCCNEVHSVEV